MDFSVLDKFLDVDWELYGKCGFDIAASSHAYDDSMVVYIPERRVGKCDDDTFVWLGRCTMAWSRSSSL